MDREPAVSAASDREGPAGTGETASAALDGHGVVSAWSPEAQKLLGYDQAEAVGRAVERLLGEPLPEAVRGCCVGGRAWEGQVAVRHRDGHRLDVRIRARPLVDAVGSVHWYLEATPPAPPESTGVGSGTADAPLIEQWALEQLPLPVALFDDHAQCIAVNAAMTLVMGQTKGDLLGTEVGVPGSSCRMTGLENIGDAVEQVWRSGDVVQREAHLSGPGEAQAYAGLVTLSPVRDHTGHVRAVSLAAAGATEQFHARRRLRVLNEAGIRIGTTLDLARTADELAQVGTDHFADFVLVDLLDSVLSGGIENAAYEEHSTFRRAAQRSVLPGCPEAVIPTGAVHAYHRDSPPGRALAAGRATHQLVDEAVLRSWAAGSPERARSIRVHHIHSVMSVPLCARGVTLGLAAFCRHRTPEPFDEEDLRLADELAARAAVYIDNARRYSREHEIALTLQRSLLPDSVPRQAGVEVASRYLPADPGAGIGGDWFDVIPLSGARVALVVGDVAGRGIQASATMGRLCTAVRTLADVDLAPDELLTQLDDLVLRLDRQAAADGTDVTGDRMVNEVGATCLYAVYDPVSRHCSMARAGHPEPVLATQDGTVDFLDLPAGPPLGVGGLPFEVAEFELPEGSVLAFYTDGLVESAQTDLDHGRAALRDLLVHPERALEEIGDSVVRALSPDTRTDDAALLLARVKSLRADQVATWDVAAEPVAVARVRKVACDRLLAWGLEDTVVVVELVVSELVTNAIRYGHAPVQLRLIRDTTLICEVSDSSSSSPHLRRARVSDEGGRGLLIVAQLTQRWGSRHTRTGKVIWAEVPLGGEESGSW
ncbi:SpoIIE family protein phosphatase [Streptomyces sp. NPDC090499]|uniref:SpoIIE family protein phosphatase n=1 Tax=unclassified Streptomyces TaxID=2593676 RepID=UPI00380FC450